MSALLQELRRDITAVRPSQSALDDRLEQTQQNLLAVEARLVPYRQAEAVYADSLQVLKAASEEALSARSQRRQRDPRAQEATRKLSQARQSFEEAQLEWQRQGRLTALDRRTERLLKAALVRHEQDCLAVDYVMAHLESYFESLNGALTGLYRRYYESEARALHSNVDELGQPPA